MESWQKVLIAAGGTAAAAALLYHLCREGDPEAEAAEAAKDGVDKGAALAGRPGLKKSMTKEELTSVLAELVESQKATTDRMKGVSKQLADSGLTCFDKIYQMVKEVEPEDPLQRRGLSMNDLDEPLERHQQHPEIMMAMQALMGAGQEVASPPQNVTVEKITEINLHLLEELENFIKMHKELPDKSKYDMKTVMIMVQATLDAKVMKKFGLESSEINAASQHHQEKLAKSKEFRESHTKMQQTMESFMTELSKSFR